MDKLARPSLLRRLFGKGEQNHSAPSEELTVPPDSLSSDINETTNVTGQAAVLERLDAIERRLADLAQQPQMAPAPAAGGEGIAALQQALASLEKQINRAGREQLKANSLVEAQAEQFNAALEALRTADVRREAEITLLREQNRAAESAARLEVVRAILPVIDGLDEALRSGQQLLDRPAPPAARRGLFARLRRRAPTPVPTDGVLREGMAAWLVGLTFVRQRLLDVLAAEAVVPIEAQGQPFDPQRHVALDVVPAGETLPPGTVAAELRRGYLVGDRVLRHAEVAVAKQQGTEK
jgi:molecular chaperone GrpE